jgi:hypothetical protein
MRSLIAIAVLLVAAPLAAQEQAPPSIPYTMEIPASVREWYRNPDGSCVQCSIGLCGIWQLQPAAAALLWDSPFGPKVRGGSGPSRVDAYCESRKIPVWNITGANTWDWMKWAARTRRFAAIGAGRIHFQTLYGWDPSSNTWYVENNNSPQRVDSYSWEEFRRLHLSSGQWVVVLDLPPPAPVPQYVRWW